MVAQADFDPVSLLTELRRRAWFLVAITAGAAILAFGVSDLQSDRYVATADLLFHGDVNANAPERTAATNLALANIDAVVDGVRHRLNVDLPLKELRDSVQLQPRGQADLMQIEASAGTAMTAVRLANAFADEVVAVRLQTARNEIQRHIDSIDARLSQTDPSTELASDLAQRRKNLFIDRAVASGDVEVVDRAAPPLQRAAPSPLRDAGVAGVIGFTVAVMLLALLRAFDRQLSDEQTAELFGAPVLARVPVNGRKAWRQQLYAEAFQFLQTNVMALMTEDVDTLGPRKLRDQARGRVVVVTSPLPASGKSSIVARLSEALAASGTRVLVVDSDLRKPTLAYEFGLPDDRPGLADVLLNHEEAEQLRVANERCVQTSVAGLSVLSGGSVGGFGMPVAGPQRVLNIIEMLRSKADMVLVDTAPVAIAAETSILAAQADGVIVVLDARDLDRDTLGAARDQLHRVGATVLGLVLNFAEAPDERALKAAYRIVQPPEPHGTDTRGDGQLASTGDKQPRPSPQRS